MRRVYISAAMAVILVVALVGAGFANGAKPTTTPPAVTTPPPSVPAGPAAGPAPTCPPSLYGTNELITLTVAEAWELSGKNEANFSRMVQQLAELSARNRCMVLSDSTEMGMEIGRSIRQNAEANPNQLLYTAVDNAMVTYSAAHPTPAGVGAGPATFTYSANQLLPLNIAQAWQLAGRDDAKMTRMINTLIDLSVARRGVTFQDASATYADIGRMVRQRLISDPNQLLYAAVDSAVVQYAAAQSPAATR